MNRKEKKKATFHKITNAAISLFEEQGYEATTVQQICQKAGIAKGTFFNYFKTKEDVLNDLFRYWAAEEVIKVKNKPGPLISRLKALVIELINRMELSRPLIRIHLQSILANEKSRAAHQSQIDVLTGILTEIYAAKQDSGELRTDMPPDMLAQMTVQTYFGVMLHWSLEQGDENLTEQMALSLEVFFRGLAHEHR